MKVYAYRSSLSDCGYVSLVREDGKYVCDGRKNYNNPVAIADFCRNALQIDTFSTQLFTIPKLW